LRMGKTITLVPSRILGYLRPPTRGSGSRRRSGRSPRGRRWDEHVIGGPDGRPAEPLGDLGRGLDALGRGTVGEIRAGRVRSPSSAHHRDSGGTVLVDSLRWAREVLQHETR
jgi:hypothetical protein